MPDRWVFLNFKLLLRKYDIARQQMSAAPLRRVVLEIHVACFWSDSYNICAFSFRNAGVAWEKNGSVTQSRCYVFNHPYCTEAFDVSALGFYTYHVSCFQIPTCYEETDCRGNGEVCSTERYLVYQWNIRLLWLWRYIWFFLYLYLLTI